jgi:hypothetical protein
LPSVAECTVIVVLEFPTIKYALVDELAVKVYEHLYQPLPTFSIAATFPLDTCFTVPLSKLNTAPFEYTSVINKNSVVPFLAYIEIV